MHCAEEAGPQLVQYSSSPGKASAGMVRTPAGYAMSMDSSSHPHAMPGQPLPLFTPCSLPDLEELYRGVTHQTWTCIRTFSAALRLEVLWMTVQVSAMASCRAESGWQTTCRWDLDAAVRGLQRRKLEDQRRHAAHTCWPCRVDGVILRAFPALYQRSRS